MNSNIKFDRKHIRKGHRVLNKLKLKHAEKKMMTEINSKLYSANDVLAYFIYTNDYEAIKEICQGIGTFAHDKWLGYIDPTIWTTEEHEYLQEQFEVKINFDDIMNLYFDVDAFTKVEFIKHAGQKDVKYWVLTSCSFMDGYNDPMTSEYFDPTDTIAAKKAFEAIIVKVKQDMKMNLAYVKRQSQDILDKIK